MRNPGNGESEGNVSFGSPTRYCDEIASYPINIQMFKEVFHGVVHAGNERGKLKGFFACRTVHVGFMAGAADIQSGSAVRAGKRGAGFPGGEEERHERLPSVLRLNISASQDPVFWLTGFMSPPEQTQAACGGAGQRASRRSFVLPDAAEHFDGEMFREKAVQLSSCR